MYKNENISISHINNLMVFQNQSEEPKLQDKDVHTAQANSIFIDLYLHHALLSLLLYLHS